MKKYFFAAAVLTADIILKQIALRAESDFFLIPKIFAFKLFQNSTLGFSLYSPPILIIVLSIIILLGLAILVYKKPALLFPSTLIWLGAASNLSDRLRFGFVIDYFYLWPFSYFNLADLLIFIGALLLIYKISKK